MTPFEAVTLGQWRKVLDLANDGNDAGLAEYITLLTGWPHSEASAVAWIEAMGAFLAWRVVLAKETPRDDFEACLVYAVENADASVDLVQEEKLLARREALDAGFAEAHRVIGVQ